MLQQQLLLTSIDVNEVNGTLSDTPTATTFTSSPSNTPLNVERSQLSHQGTIGTVLGGTGHTLQDGIIGAQTAQPRGQPRGQLRGSQRGQQGRQGQQGGGISPGSPYVKKIIVCTHHIIPLHAPFIHLHYRIYTYVHPQYMHIHNIYTSKHL